MITNNKINKGSHITGAIWGTKKCKSNFNLTN